MRLTDVKVTKIEDAGKIKAIASIVIDNELCVKEIKVIEENEKVFIVMPNRKTLNGGFKNIAHPTNRETGEKIKRAILDEYRELK